MAQGFHGLETRSLENGHLWLECLVGAGPRIVGLGLPGRPNLLADLNELVIPTPAGPYRIYGGHRLWTAPEGMPRSYLADDAPVTIDPITGGIRMSQPVEALSGIKKTIEVTLAPARAAATITHQLENTGLWAVELAAWALTKLRQGGIGLFPQTQGELEPTGLLPNRNLVFWPYTRLSDPRLVLADDYAFIKADPAQPPVKIGYMNRQGWIGYLNQGTLFVKRFAAYPDRPHVDYGCNTEGYCGDMMIEMETVSPLFRLEPGASAVHVEEWELYPADGVPATPEGVRSLVKSLGLA